MVLKNIAKQTRPAAINTMAVVAIMVLYFWPNPQRIFKAVYLWISGIDELMVFFTEVFQKLRSYRLFWAKRTFEQPAHRVYIDAHDGYPD
jgi:hypothetical protein